MTNPHKTVKAAPEKTGRPSGTRLRHLSDSRHLPASEPVCPQTVRGGDAMGNRVDLAGGILLD
jgi:hypothetical protein